MKPKHLPVTLSGDLPGPYDKIPRPITPRTPPVRDNGYKLTPGFHDFVSSHETDNPEEFITEVCYPAAGLTQPLEKTAPPGMLQGAPVVGVVILAAVR